MEIYNKILLNHEITKEMFILPFGSLLTFMLVVIALETLIGGPLARKLAFQLVTPEKNRLIVVILAIQTMTVCIMCPMMSFIATLIFKDGFHSQMIAKWIQTLIINFPMALCWQIFIAGPLVRTIVFNLLKDQKAN